VDHEAPSWPRPCDVFVCRAGKRVTPRSARERTVSLAPSKETRKARAEPGPGATLKEEFTSVSQTNDAFEKADLGGVPLPGSGRTWQRFEALARWAEQDLSFGRLAEGHVDALAILAEAGKKPADSEATYGVWAARVRSGGTRARRELDGWHLSGTKPFCSGSVLIDRALVTADTDDGYQLFDISVPETVTAIHPHSWLAVGMAESLSETLDFGGPAIPGDRLVGEPGFYLERPGFWFGAVGVAACWYGGAKGLVDRLRASLEPSTSDAVAAELGYAVSHVSAMRRSLQGAAKEIDEDPRDTSGEARTRALEVRHAVHHAATEVLGHVASLGGARPLCHDREQAQRAADLYVYLAQHHGPHDAAELGRIAWESRTCHT
jgi:alkylation response protein AidB-like acyl-CoA dehydrogenase